MPTNHNGPLYGAALGAVALFFATFLAIHFDIAM
jgi:hypothetical protein